MGQDMSPRPLAADPAGLWHARQALADITPEICPQGESSGGVVRNNSAAEATVWAA